jgi:ABC-type uncharacterized transport system auxiliary subunit
MGEEARGKSMKRVAIATLLMSCALAGCIKARSPRFYTLSAPPMNAVVNAQPMPVTIVVGHLYAPHLLRDDRVVYSLSDVELGVDEYHRWAEPPTGMVERLIVERLRMSGQYRTVERLASTTRGDYILRGHLAALNEVDDSSGLKARFSLQLELFDVKAGYVVWSDRYNADEPVPEKTVTSVVQALQKNVNHGIDQLTAGLAQYFAAHPPH